MTWDPKKYMAFGAERTRPAAELLARVSVEAPRHVIDLGCGPGNSTELLAQRWQEAETVGLDSSPEMILARSPRARENICRAVSHVPFRI